MNVSAPELFARYFAALERENIPYVVLHSYEQFPEDIPSDVDVAVADDALPRALAMQRTVAEEAGWRLAQVFQHEHCAHYTVLADPSSPRAYLALDICSHYVCDGRRLLRDDELLFGRRRHRDVWISSPSSEFIYRLSKALVKRKALEPLLPRLREHAAAEPQRAQQLFRDRLGEAAGNLNDWPGTDAERWRAVLLQRGRPNQLAEWKRRCKRVWRPTGLRIDLLGPDGAGKSATIAGLREVLAPFFRARREFHFAPMLGRRRDGGPVTEPHKLPPRSAPVSWIKVAYHAADHWLGWLGQQWPARVRSTLVIFDRDFDDLLVDPRRYRLQCSDGLAQALSKAVPGSDLTFVLDAAPEVLHARKPELSLAELARQRAVLRELAVGDERFVIVSAESPVQTVVEEVARKVVEHLAGRLS